MISSIRSRSRMVVRNLLAVSLAAVLTLASSGPAHADISVTNYSWLQLPPENLSVTISNSSNASASGDFGSPSAAALGGYVWIPSQTFTDTGTNSYDVTLNLGQARDITSVSTQWWMADSGMSLSSFSIQGSNDGVSFTTIGTYSSGTFAGDKPINNLAVTPGTYQYLRVDVPTGGYTVGASWGGPGLWMIEPFGNGTVSNTQINYANKNVFSTTATVHALTIAGTGFNNGLIDDLDDPYRAGDTLPWNGSGYVQLDLGQVRDINQVVLVWDDANSADSAQISYSTDGINFFNVSDPILSNLYPGIYGDLSIGFDDVGARYLRVSDLTGSGFGLIDQVLAYDLPEPGSLALIVLAGSLLLRRRRA